MSGTLRTIGQIAGVVAGVALIGTGIGAALGGTMVLSGVASASTIATVASAVAAVATTGSSILQKGPDTKGQVNDRIIGSNNPQPYIMGRTYSGGVQVHDVGYGGEVDDVDNPYRFIAVVYSCCGPLESLEAVQLDFATVSFSGNAATGYYADYLWRDYQLGARPEAGALSPQIPGTPGWGTSYKLSGFGAIGFTLKWSKKGERFSGGQIPAIGAIWEGVKVYDPRLDSTYPGGSGSHRIDDETTWTYSRNPALHALAYAYGRYVNGVKVFGVDLGGAAIDGGDVVAWANTCDTNGWTVNGTIYEPGDKWNNLQRICEAGGARPVMRGGTLGFDWQAPRTSLYTITKDDLAGPVRARLSKGWKNRHNTLVPRYRSEAHQWNYQQAAAVQVSAWVTADGEIKSDEKQWDLVTEADQVTELAMYELYQRREAGPFSLPCKPHMRDYGPGDCVTLAEELGAHPSGSIKAIIINRSVDPTTGEVSFELEQETDAKHAAALGLTGTTAPPPTLPTGEDIEGTLGGNASTDGSIFDGGDETGTADPTQTGVRIRVRRATAAEWTAEDPVLLEAEPGLETDTLRVKYGDGSSAWSALDYASEEETGFADLTGYPTDNAALAAILGDLADAGAVSAALDLKADIASPALTGTPTAPTAADGTDTAQIATTEFANAAVPHAFEQVTSWSPAITASSGTFTTVSSDGQYIRIGKLVVFCLEVAITTAGTATANLEFNLPVASAKRASFAGRVTGGGNACAVDVAAGNTTVRVRQFNGLTIIANGVTVALAGSYITT